MPRRRTAKGAWFMACDPLDESYCGLRHHRSLEFVQNHPFKPMQAPFVDSGCKDL